MVADEVRALAEHTTRATNEIGEMIKTIQNETKSAVAAMEAGVHQVESGTIEAARSGEALRNILEHINAVAVQVNQIATAAEEQTAATSEISGDIHQITNMVHQTSRGAQESATAAAQLNGNADDLERLVNGYGCCFPALWMPSMKRCGPGTPVGTKATLSPGITVLSRLYTV